ncbi:hypothetical protein A5788_23120 [Gordonia sp. 852002-50816_SCH5313054-c]|nr:hypothetical protein A5788_23120 [Gordonia sp. 852002-50816_SCH5313054-c]OBC14501.1 hypothetical protein A5786_02580 [Gordonia sp. 852002-50816_SCH5313054-a]
MPARILGRPTPERPASTARSGTADWALEAADCALLNADCAPDRADWALETADRAFIEADRSDTSRILTAW